MRFYGTGIRLPTAWNSYNSGTTVLPPHGFLHAIPAPLCGLRTGTEDDSLLSALPRLSGIRVAVSYTHLDVYKRQGISFAYCTTVYQSPIRRIGLPDIGILRSGIIIKAVFCKLLKQINFPVQLGDIPSHRADDFLNFGIELLDGLCTGIGR